MNNDRPLRAVLMKTFHCCGTTFFKGEIFDISKFDTANGHPVVYLKFGSGAIAVMPSSIQILAPDPKPCKTKNKRWNRKKKKCAIVVVDNSR